MHFHLYAFYGSGQKCIPKADFSFLNVHIYNRKKINENKFIYKKDNISKIMDIITPDD